MLNVPELEQQWQKRKYKRYVPSTVLMTILIILVAGIVYLKYNKINNKHLLSIKKPATAQSRIKPKQDINNTVQKTINTPKTQTTPMMAKAQTIHALKPSMEFIDNIQAHTNSNQYTTIIHPKKHIANKSNTTKLVIAQKKIIQHQQTPTKAVTPPKVKQSSIIIKSIPMSSDMQNIIERFKRTNDPVLGLFLARRYYQLKKYNLAYNYALLTNRLNNNNEQSWLIFAKSLVKLGQTSMAIQTLKSYIKNSHSANAEVLLEDIQSGQFK